MYKIDGRNQVRTAKHTEMRNFAIIFHRQTKHTNKFLQKKCFARDRMIKFKKTSQSAFVGWRLFDTKDTFLKNQKHTKFY